MRFLNSLGRGELAVLALVVSFCSLCFELLLANTVTVLVGHSVLSNSIVIGSYLLGIGIGTLLAEKRSPPEWLPRIESLLAISGLLLGIFCFLVQIAAAAWATSLQGSAGPEVLLSFAGVAAVAVGILTGFEVPLLLKAAPEGSVPFVLGFNYFGALLASLVLPMLLLPRLDVLPSWLFIGFLNLGIAAYVSYRYGRWPLRFLGAAVFSGFLALYAWKPIESFYLRSYYGGIFPVDVKGVAETNALLKARVNVTRERSAYQHIDFVELHFRKVKRAFYLDRRLQVEESNSDSYHSLMARVPGAVTGTRPKIGLILGGGDGILAHYLLEKESFDRVTLVELDPRILELAVSHPLLSSLNRGTLKSPKLKAIVDDAYAWVRRDSERYDAVFLDFPFPTDYDTSRLYSYEFYRAALARVREGGFLVLDFPIAAAGKTKEGFELNSYVFSTLIAAGCAQPIPYGSLNDSFILCPKGAVKRPPESEIAKLLPKDTLFRFFDPELAMAEISESRVHSVFRPKFGLGSSWWMENE